jgi:predicted ATPase/class 3 adenylate cyclase
MGSGGDDAPPRESSGRVAERSHNLPSPLTTFVGRSRELAEMRELLRSTRLLSLVGSGGAGKTRLAVHYATASRADVPDGAWLVELAPLLDGDRILPTIADVFDLREQPGVGLSDLVVAHLADRRLLLLLDNCEHLLEPTAHIAERILASCPDVTILATSREPIRVPGEVVMRVPPLGVPDDDAVRDPASVAAFDAVRLFGDRARAVSPAFELTETNAAHVATLCARLDGLPLAIELAASRVGLFPISTIVERLDDRFQLLVGGSRTALSRQQTLRAMLDWSYQLLDDDERILLQALSVFVGGVALDAVEGICRADGIDVLPLLGQLVDKSLLTFDSSGDEPRYRLLETVREYGLEQLSRSGRRATVEGRHAAWFRGLAERAVATLPTPERGPGLARLEREHDNIRSALERSSVADPQEALGIASVMWHFWLWRAYLAEGRRWLESVLTRLPGETPLHAEARLGASVLSSRAGDGRAGQRLAAEALAIFRGRDDVRSCCRALHAMAPAAFTRDQLDDAEGAYEESLDLATEGGYGPGRAAALQGLGIVRWYRGRREEGVAHLRESLELFRSQPDPSDLAPSLLDVGELLVREPATGTLRMAFQETISSFLDVPCRTAVGSVLANLGVIARADGDLGTARASLEEALAVFELLADERAIAQTLGRLGNLATQEGDFDRAERLLDRSVEIRRRIGDGRGVTLAESNLGYLATARGDHERAGALLRDAAETFRRRGDRWGYAATLGHLASLALAEGKRRRARELLERSLITIDEIGIARWKAWALMQLGSVARLEADDGAADAQVGAALEIFRRLDDARGVEHATSFLARSTRRSVATVLFGDIVGSTETAMRIGDREWRTLLDGFRRMVATKAEAFGGRVVDTAGDGFLSVFEGPRPAIAAAVSIREGAAEIGLGMRAGLHTGEIERVGDTVQGIAVHIGARAAATAGAGDILVTRTVRDLVLGSGIDLEDRGTHALKGVPGTWELFAVVGGVGTE